MLAIEPMKQLTHVKDVERELVTVLIKSTH